MEGNALFGQWTYGGDGLVPEQQRKKLGDHRIASYEWPFDSVRDYFIRSNELDIADDAVFRDEPMSFIIGAADQDAAEKLRKDIEAMRKSGELAVIIERMRLG